RDRSPSAAFPERMVVRPRCAWAAVAAALLAPLSATAAPPDEALAASLHAESVEPGFAKLESGRAFGLVAAPAKRGKCGPVTAVVASDTTGAWRVQGKATIDLVGCADDEPIAFEMVWADVDMDCDGRAEAAFIVSYATESVPGVGSDFLTRYIVLDLETLKVEINAELTSTAGASIGPHREARALHFDVDVDGHFDLVIVGEDCEGDDVDLDAMHCTPFFETYVWSAADDTLHRK
ncbi:MAG: hypothetical protein AAF721_12195, partial [Myxococcota bacterium]